MTTRAEARLSEALRDLADVRPPHAIDVVAIEDAGRRLQRRTMAIRGTAGVAFSALLVAALALSGVINLGGARRGTSDAQAGAHGQLAVLAAYIQRHAAAPTGDATLVVRTQSYASGGSNVGYDLYADDGTEYYGISPSNLTQGVATHQSEAGASAVSREAVVAVYALTGDLSVARERMAHAALQPGITPKVIYPSRISVTDTVDNLIWENCLDTLTIDGGTAQVRAGVLRLLATLPEVSVVRGSTSGQPSLTLSAGSAMFSNGQMETLVINANTGVPIGFSGGTSGHVPDVTISYQVSRVSLAQVAAGRL